MAGRRSTSSRDDASGEPPRSTPKDIARIEFGRRLNSAMVRKGWNQSELARHAQAHTPDGVKGVSRDLISKYLGGKVIPSPLNLQILCDTLGVKREDLFPVATTAETGEELPRLAMRQIADGRVWVTVHQLVEFGTALQVLNLLKPSDSK